MTFRTFGKTGWRVSPVGVGCWQFGGVIMLDGKPDGWTGVNDDESIAAIQRAVELGINFFDTADMYGWGRSEEIVGKTLKPHRDRVFIATKVGYWHDDQGRRTFNESKDYILRACESSLRRLQTDRIDLYQCHLSRTKQWTEFLDAFELLQQQGKIRHFGISTHDFDVMQGFNGRNNLASVQSNYNLLDRTPEQRTLPYCQKHGIAFIARGPLAMGKLSGNYSKDAKFDSQDIRNKWLEDGNRNGFERDMATVEKLRPVAAHLGITLSQLAIRFALGHEAVSIAIPGAKNRKQLEGNVAAASLPPLTRDETAAAEKAIE